MFIWRHLIFCFSSAIGDIKIAEVNAMGLYVKLINSSLDKEVEIGNHFLQQNVNGQRVSVYQFLPSIIMQANTTVTVSIRYKYYEVEWYRKISFTGLDCGSSPVVTSSLNLYVKCDVMLAVANCATFSISVCKLIPIIKFQ